VDLLDHLLGVLDHAGARDDRQDQPVLGVVGDVVPPVSLVVIGRVGGVAMRRLLGDERPFLVELDLAGLGGKRPRVRRGRLGRAARPCEPAA
jgi:hypothetical protein